ncbi:hypothetical protein SCLCIDRAFT_1222733 [Scleroderma citrinum Foug A]|uniref:Uncharacterized protein n=1 Tax=Scleroderma citrinum Foug A TaxID=1036808 RepID=A0A0C3CY46_9AGAM|nr:hypothetical protein SCLCIDRAFT_1222733 [Scleroderma citrinum Foug A]
MKKGTNLVWSHPLERRAGQQVKFTSFLSKSLLALSQIINCSDSSMYPRMGKLIDHPRPKCNIPIFLSRIQIESSSPSRKRYWTPYYSSHLPLALWPMSDPEDD